MQRALELARRGRGHVSPNPMVGAVIVACGRVVGEGWHRRLGSAHAEVEALLQARERARGATMYVTMEPCNHEGRTPPCTAQLLAAGIRRVVAACADPNPQVTGGGFALLRAAGVVVERGVCEKEARELNRTFFTWALRHRPFVTLKMALTADGRLACHTGHSRWISGEASRRRGHEERALHDAILVGVGTVLADNPRLDVRLDGEHRSGRRVVLDSRLRTPPDAHVVPGALILTLDDHAAGPLRAAGAEVVRVEGTRPAEGPSQVSLHASMKELWERSITSMLVEGGGRVHASFLRHKLVDRVLSFVAPKVVGGRHAPTGLGVAGSQAPGESVHLQSFSLHECGDDLLLEGTLQEVWT